MKHYFIKVNTWVSASQPDRELQTYVYNKYHRCVIDEDCVSDIFDDIKKKSLEISKKYPRCKIKDFYQDVVDNCPYFSYGSYQRDQYAFTITFSEVQKRYRKGDLL